jgi:hypothetical protein
MPDNNQYLTPGQFLREAQGALTYPQLWRALKNGTIRSVQPLGAGSHHRIPRSELERLCGPPEGK